MQLQFSIYALPLIIAAILSLLTGIYIWPRRTVPGATPLALIAFVITFWSLGYAQEIMATELTGKFFWGRVQYVGIALAPYCWLLFAEAYTARGKPRPWTPLLPWLTLFPLTTILLAFTTSWHGLIWREISLVQQIGFTALGVTYGAWFWLHFVVSYLFLFVGAVILVRDLWGMQGVYRGQTTAVLVAVLAPWVSNILYFTNLSPIPGLDLTPFAFTITVLALAWAIFGYRIIDIAPIARDLVLENMREGVLVINLNGRVADVNPVAARVIGLPVAQILGEPATELLAPWPALITALATSVNKQTQLTISIGHGEGQMQYAVRVAPFADQQAHPLGHIITIQTAPTNQPNQPTIPVAIPQEPSPPPIPFSAPSTPVAATTEREIPPLVADYPFLRPLFAFFLPPHQPLEQINVVAGESPRLTQLLEQTFTIILRLGFLLFLLTFLPSATYLPADQPLVFFAFLAGIGLTGVLGFVRRIPFTSRVRLFLLAIYVVSVVELLGYGYSLEAFVFLLTAVVIGTLFLGVRGGLITFGISLLTVLTLGWYMAQGIYQPFVNPNALPHTLTHAVASSGVFIATSGIMGAAITILLRSINIAWREEVQMRNLLQQERDNLDQRVIARTQQLRDSEASLLSFINSTPAIIVQINPTYEIIFGHIPGLTEEASHKNVMGRKLFDFIQGAYQTEVEEAIDFVFATQQTSQLEFMAFNPVYSAERAYLTSIAPLFEEEQVHSVLLICTDITERKEAEAQLARTAHDLVQAQLLGKMGNWEWHFATQETSWSAQMYALFGLTDHETVPSREQFRAAIHADDQALADEALAQLLAGGEYNFQYRIVRPDGRLRYMQSWADLVRNAQGEPAILKGVTQDITERIEAELALKKLYQVIATPHDSSAAQLQNALRVGSELLGLPLGIISQIEGNNYVVLHVHTAEAGLAPGHQFHFPDTVCAITYQADDLVTIEHMGASVYKNHPCYAAFGLEAYIGVPLYVAGKRFGTLNFSDTAVRSTPFTPAQKEFILLMGQWVSAEVERELAAKTLESYATQLAIARDQALEASRYKSLLLSKVSHELRTPLGGIIGYAELLQDEFVGSLDPEQMQFVQNIVLSARHLNGMIGDLLDQAQIEQGTLKVAETPFVLASMAEFLRGLLQPIAAEKGLNFALECDDNLPEIIMGDEKRLRQIIINLANNALKFTQTGEVCIRLEALPSSEAWQIVVEDTGPGISPEAQSKIFDSFWQVDGSATSGQKGYGLGLSIVQHLVQLMHGRVEVTSQPGQGSTFTVCLPLKTFA